MVVVNQKANGSQWMLLGSFMLDPANSPSISLTDQANGYVIADAVMAVPEGATPNTATWALGVTAPGSYNVYARWSEHVNRASNAAYTVTNEGGSTVVTVDQQSNGGQWNLLGSFTLDPANNPSVSVTDQANGYVIADAVMAVLENGAANSAQWTMPAGTYEVYARWTAHPNRATNAPFTVNHAQGASLVTVNQQSNGAQWNLLGSFTFSSAAHNVTLTDEADGYVVADAIRLVSLAPAQAQVYFIHADHLNTPRVITDVNQVAVWRWDNEDPFGANVASEDPDGNGLAVTCNLRFPGQYFDRETGNHYNFFRDYSPETGRYIESDPIGLRGGLNTFGYVDNTPTQGVDPAGLTKWTGTNLSFGAVFASFEIFTLFSECVDGQRAIARIHAWGIGAGKGFGMLGGGIDFDTGPLQVLDPYAFEGDYASASIGGAFGIGASYGGTILGMARSDPSAKVIGGVGGSFGFAVGGGILGGAEVKSVTYQKCGCSND